VSRSTSAIIIEMISTVGKAAAATLVGIGSFGLALLLAQCKQSSDLDRDDGAAERAKDGKPCANDSECRDGGACLHGLCLGPTCTCKTEKGDFIGIPLGSREVCRGDCVDGWSCGVAAGHSPEADAGPQLALRCMPDCAARYPADAASGCPDGLVCATINANAFDDTCVLAAPTVVVEGPPSPLTEETTVTLTARDTSRFSPIAGYAWQRNSGGGDAVGPTATFEVPRGNFDFKATVMVHDALGIRGFAQYTATICSIEGRDCSITPDAGYQDCCPGLRCVKDSQGFQRCRTQ
jgi:hypothetical protein